MDSLTKSKSRAHSRLASLGRIRSRGSIHNTAAAHQSRVAADAELPPSLHQPQGETVSLLAKPTHPGLAAPPVSPSDACSHHKASDTSTLSNSSSETTRSDDKSDDIKSLEEAEIPTSTRTHAFREPSQNFDDPADVDRYNRAVQHRPRMMHQTSSRLLRMTADDRPFTRVCIPLPHCTIICCMCNCIAFLPVAQYLVCGARE